MAAGPSEMGLCENCGAREATDTWEFPGGIRIGKPDQFWCRVCVLAQQIPFARAVAEMLPDKETEFEKLTGYRFGDDEMVIEWRAGDTPVQGPGAYVIDGRAESARPVVILPSAESATPSDSDGVAEGQD